MRKRLFFAALMTFAGTSLIGSTASGQNYTSINEALEKSERQALQLRSKQSTDEDLPSYIVSGNMVYYLEKKKHTLNKTKEDIVADANSSIFPGAIVYIDDELANGNPREVPGLSRGKATIKVNYNTGNTSNSKSYRDDVPLEASKVQDFLYDILNKSTYRPSIKAKSGARVVSTLNQLAVTLGVEASFLKEDVNVNTDISSTNSTITEVEDWTQTFYTVSIDLPSDRSKLFASNVTPDMVAAKAKNYPIGIITSVTYGRRAYIFKDVTTNNFHFTGDQSVSGNNHRVSSVQDIMNSAKDSSVWMWVSGMDEHTTQEMLRGKSIRSAIIDKLKFDPATNQGEPISYTVLYLGSGRQAKVQLVGEYTEVSYVPLFNSVSCILKQRASVCAGAWIKMRLDYKVVKISNDGKLVEATKQPGAIYTRYDERQFKSQSDAMFNLQLGQGECLDGPIHVNFRVKRSSSGKPTDEINFKVYPIDGRIYIANESYIGPGGSTSRPNSGTQPFIVP